jgi:hypothetical protein
MPSTTPSKHVTGRMWIWSIALALVAVAATFTIVFANMSATEAAKWTMWLQNSVNTIRLFEVAALGFTAYQFMAGRTERRAAEAEEARRARKDANYQAWQVINSAQGKGGSGGRVDALADLVRNDISLAGINLDHAWLESIDLRDASLPMASFEKCNLQGAQFDGARLDAPTSGTRCSPLPRSPARACAAPISPERVSPPRIWRVPISPTSTAGARWPTSRTRTSKECDLPRAASWNGHAWAEPSIQPARP